MRLNRITFLGGTILALCTTSLRAETAPCRTEAYEERSFIVCEFDLARYDLKLFWKKPDGEAYGSIPGIPHSGPNGVPLVFATNGGMYHADRSPVGLYIESGAELKPASTRWGFGNFHLKPNGIFYVTGKTAGVMETGRFLRERPRADYATQSGPMLVIGGRIHPRFQADSSSLKIRNGVGVSDTKKVVFAISSERVTFMQFAKLFRDRLHCADALYLDGTISSVYAPSVGRDDRLFPLGPIVGIYGRE